MTLSHPSFSRQSLFVFFYRRFFSCALYSDDLFEKCVLEKALIRKQKNLKNCFLLFFLKKKIYSKQEILFEKQIFLQKNNFCLVHKSGGA